MIKFKFQPFISMLIITITVLLVLGIPTCINSEPVSPKEKELLTQLRPLIENILLEDYMKTDEYLVRFLRVKSNNVQSAAEKIRDVMKWRIDTKVTDFLLEDFSDMEAEYPFLFDGKTKDNDGRPLAILNICALDLRKVIISGNGDRFIRYYARFLEIAEGILNEINQEQGTTNITQAYAIINMGGFNARQHACIQCVPLLIRMFQVSFIPTLFQ